LQILNLLIQTLNEIIEAAPNVSESMSHRSMRDSFAMSGLPRLNTDREDPTSKEFDDYSDENRHSARMSFSKSAKKGRNLVLLDIETQTDYLKFEEKAV
jgi:hypothetical protein